MRGRCCHVHDIILLIFVLLLIILKCEWMKCIMGDVVSVANISTTSEILKH